MEEVLDIFEEVEFDDRIIKKQTYTYLPYTNSFNYSDEIRISCNNEDLFALPCESYLYLNVTATPKLAATETSLTLVNNFPLFLFEQVRYQINSIQIDQTRNIGVTSLMKTLTSINATNEIALENAGFQRSNFTLEKDAKTYSFAVPLSMILGFADDYKKIIANAKHELILTRSNSDNNAYFVTVGTSACTFTINKIEWRLPHVVVDAVTKLKILNFIAERRPVKIAFRSWDYYEYPQLPLSTTQTWQVKTSTGVKRPRYILFAMQTDRKNNKLANNSVFDNCDLNNLTVFLNSQRYPYEDMNINFKNNDYSVAYNSFKNFMSYYYDKNAYSSVKPLEFASKETVLVIDCSRQDESVKNSTIDVRLDFRSNEAFKSKTTAYTIILHDNLFNYHPANGVIEKII